MLRPLFALGTLLLALAGVLSPAAFAAQDKFTYNPNGGPMQGFEVRSILTFTGSPGVAYVALRSSGIFKTTDGGDTWTPKNNGINGSQILRSLFGSSSTTLYTAVQGDAGIYKSTDSGDTWVPKNNGLACRYVRGARLDGTDVLAFTSCDTQSGVYRSTDGGDTWTRIYTSLPDDFRAFNMFRVSGTEIYVHGNYGVYHSLDNGVTFSLANGTGLNVLSSPLSSQVFAFQRRSTGRLIAHMDGNGIFYSDDVGLNWFQASGVPANGFSFTGFTSLGSDVYLPIDGAGLYKSTNNGANWFQETTFAGLPGAGTRFLFVDPNTSTTRWAGTLAGVYKSTDSGANWTKKSSGLPGDVNVTTGHATDPNLLLSISDTVYKSTDKGNTWAESGTGLGGTTGFGGTIGSHSSAPDTYYVPTTYNGMFKSTNAGASWFSANSGIPMSTPPRNFRVATSDAATLYATAPCQATGAPGGVFKSTNSAGSWTDVSSNLTNKCVFSLAVHPTDPNTVYVSTGRAFYLGTNGGSYQTSNGNREGGLYKTTNGGLSWTFKNPGGVQFGVNSPEILASDPLTLMVGSYDTDNLDRATPLSGAYLSRDGGDSWTQLISNEKITQARFVKTPGGRVDAYVITYGYFDEPSNRDIAFKCINAFYNEFNGTNCVRLDIGVGTRSANTFSFRSGKIAAINTSSGVGGHSYRHLGPDFNNDGVADVWWGHTDGRNYIWNLMRHGDISDNVAAQVNPQTSTSTRTVPSPWVIAGFGDFNRDGHTDVLWRNTSTGDNYLFLMDNGFIVGEGYLRNVPTNWSVAAVGDFNGDGYADIWWKETTGTGLHYIYLMGVPTGTFPVITGEGYMPTVGAPWVVVGTGDFNGDGKSDIWWRNTSTGDNYIYLLNGLAITSQGYTTNVPTSWSIAGFGDLNGDGKTDVIWREGTLGYNYLYPMDGLTVLGTQGYLPTVSDTTWTVQGTGDTNKDGISDILWRQNSTGYNYVWRMNGTQVQSVCGMSANCSAGVLPSIDESGWSIVNK